MSYLTTALFASMVVAPLAGQIRRIVTIRQPGGAPAWSQSYFLYERNAEIYRTHSGRADECLTCGADLPRGGRSGPEWHLSGRVFVFACEGIWAMDAASHRVWRLSPPSRAIRDLRFSRDGMRLAWTEQRDRPTLMMAAFRITGETPRLEDARAVEMPGGLRLEGVDDFRADGSELLVTASKVGTGRAAEIYACGLGMERCRQITNKPGQRDEFARLTLSGKRLIFASTEGGWLSPDARDNKSDFWLMDLDGGAAKRMTWLNEPANPDYITGGARVTTPAWDPSGIWLAALIVIDGRQPVQKLVKIEFPEPE